MSAAASISNAQVTLLQRLAVGRSARDVIAAAKIISPKHVDLVQAAMQSAGANASDGLLRAGAVISGNSTRTVDQGLASAVLSSLAKYRPVERATTALDLFTSAAENARRGALVRSKVHMARAAYHRYAILHAGWLGGREISDAEREQLTVIHARCRAAELELVSLAAGPDAVEVCEAVRKSLADPTTFRPAGWAASALLVAGLGMPPQKRLELLDDIFNALPYSAVDNPKAWPETQIWGGFTGVRGSQWIDKILAFCADIPGAGDLLWERIDTTFARMLQDQTSSLAPKAPYARLVILAEMQTLFPDAQSISAQLKNELADIMAWLETCDRKPSETEPANARLLAVFEMGARLMRTSGDPSVRAAFREAMPVAQGVVDELFAAKPDVLGDWRRFGERVLKEDEPSIQPDALEHLRKIAANDSTLAVLLSAIEDKVDIVWQMSGAYRETIIGGPVLGLRLQDGVPKVLVGEPGDGRWWTVDGSLGTIVLEQPRG